MKTLLDANLSFRLVGLLNDSFHEIVHVQDVGLDSAGDEVIWSYAFNNHYTIVSKDSDFRHFSFLHGAPPKVISIKRGQHTTEQCTTLLNNSSDRILTFLEDDLESFLILDSETA